MSSDDDMDIISSSSEDEDGEELELFIESTDDNKEDRNSEKGDESNDEEFNSISGDIWSYIIKMNSRQK